MSFKSVAQERTGNRNTNVSFPDLEGRTKISVDELMQKHPDGVTLISFGRWTPKNKDPMYPALFLEEPDRFLWSSKVLQDLIDAWIDEYAGDAVTCAKELEAEGVGSMAPAVRADDGQISLSDVGSDEVRRILRDTDLNTLTPLEAMNLLFELQKKARG